VVPFAAERWVRVRNSVEVRVGVRMKLRIMERDRDKDKAGQEELADLT
jgi:hypothetical protein